MPVSTLEVYAAEVTCYDKHGKQLGVVKVYCCQCDGEDPKVSKVVGAQSGRSTMGEWWGKTPDELATVLDGFPVPAKARWINGISPH